MEATEFVLHDMRGIIAALELSTHALPIGALKGPQGDAIYAMVRLRGHKLDELDRKRSMEWAGLRRIRGTDGRRCGARSRRREH